jgi:hypothetical protein
VIHRLRRRHRRVWIALAVLVPLLYVIALAARHPAPVVESLPELLRAVGAAAPGGAPGGAGSAIGGAVSAGGSEVAP